MECLISFLMRDDLMNLNEMLMEYPVDYYSLNP